MINQMQLEIDDFGPIENAKLNIKKLNVVAGINGSGKSTCSKLLACFLTAISKEGYFLANKKIHDNLVPFIIHWSNRLSSNKNNINDPNIKEKLDVLNEAQNFNEKYLNEYFKDKVIELKNIVDNLDFPDKPQYLKELNDINDLIISNEDEEHRYFNVTNFLLNSEFNFSELQEYECAKVNFHGIVDNCNFEYELDLNPNGIGANISEGYVDCLNFDDIVYIDNPSIFDIKTPNTLFSILDINDTTTPYHLKFLSRLLYNQKNEIDVFDNDKFAKINYFQNEFSKLMGGKIYFNLEEKIFKFNNYSMKNTASGIKQLGIIQVLLSNHYLKENSFLIIDEPEVNLHPEWQVRFAELLILLIKELNINVYVNSHSPQFIEALEVFSAKYDLIDDSVFYLSERIKDEKFSFSEIKRESLYILYDNLGNPYDEIDKIRLENAFEENY